ncbi:hypothetical protein [Empedobacter brevis]|uniref:hypothetical protein n=1 Tax=Empedobacter brevis TaxID=247 RepID=UPI0039B0767E
MIKKYKIFELISEIWGFIIIIIPFLIIGSFLGYILYENIEHKHGLILGVILFLIISTVGVIFSIKSIKKNGAFYIISRTIASSEFDKKNKKQD